MESSHVEREALDIADRTEVVLSGFVAELSRLPEVVVKLLAQHAPDPSGRCRTCNTGDGSGRVWSPCRLQRLAEAARLP
jgi:hypothetical protein